MSSYLTFYLKPKDQEKPLKLTSYSRNSPIYQAYYKTISPIFIGNDDEPKYAELTSKDAQYVVTVTKEDLDKSKRNLQNRIDAYKELGNISDEAVQDIADTKDYIKELEETVFELQFLANLVADIKYSDFEKVLINID